MLHDPVKCFVDVCLLASPETTCEFHFGDANAWLLNQSAYSNAVILMAWLMSVGRSVGESVSSVHVSDWCEPASLQQIIPALEQLFSLVKTTICKFHSA